MTLDALKEVIADLFDLEISEVQLDTPFNAQPFYDSLKVVLLMAALEEDFELTVSPEKADELSCIQDIVDYAAQKGVTFTE